MIFVHSTSYPLAAQRLFSHWGLPHPIRGRGCTYSLYNVQPPRVTTPYTGPGVYLQLVQCTATGGYRTLYGAGGVPTACTMYSHRGLPHPIRGRGCTYSLYNVQPPRVTAPYTGPGVYLQLVQCTATGGYRTLYWAVVGARDEV